MLQKKNPEREAEMGDDFNDQKRILWNKDIDKKCIEKKTTKKNSDTDYVHRIIECKITKIKKKFYYFIFSKKNHNVNYNY